MVPSEVVTAIFYNFAPERVAKALRAAWQIADPEAALRRPAGFHGRGAAPLRLRRRWKRHCRSGIGGKAGAPGAGRRTTVVRRESGAAVAGRFAGRAVACSDTEEVRTS